MKVKVVGRLSVFHFAAALFRLFDVLQRNGIDEIRHGNLYLHLYYKGKMVKYLDDDGLPLDEVVLKSSFEQSDEQLEEILSRPML